ncbi:hypothetical protein [Streptomyces sp. Ncost-T10-10d]|uniref:hypothetical protein n=1 Tax=Streptomyces sp. Ncost-T10-10d TaxID=1839774 RepID=UPI00081E9CFE|nr:hypothetical protein GA0115254_11792 [Streptomyces sp. Ncost-T10-10d]
MTATITVVLRAHIELSMLQAIGPLVSPDELLYPITTVHRGDMLLSPKRHDP